MKDVTLHRARLPG